MTLYADGRLLVCEQGSMAEPTAISRMDPRTTARGVVVDNWWTATELAERRSCPQRRQHPVHGPSYGHLQGFLPEPQAGNHVYRRDPRSGMLTVVAGDFVKPNGLASDPLRASRQRSRAKESDW